MEYNEKTIKESAERLKQKATSKLIKKLIDEAAEESIRNYKTFNK